MNKCLHPHSIYCMYYRNLKFKPQLKCSFHNVRSQNFLVLIKFDGEIPTTGLLNLQISHGLLISLSWSSMNNISHLLCFTDISNSTAKICLNNNPILEKLNCNQIIKMGELMETYNIQTGMKGMSDCVHLFSMTPVVFKQCYNFLKSTCVPHIQTKHILK